MTWRQETKWNLISDCGHYRINKALVHGKPIYQLSRNGVLLWTGELDECKGRANENHTTQRA